MIVNLSRSGFHDSPALTLHHIFLATDEALKQIFLDFFQILGRLVILHFLFRDQFAAFSTRHNRITEKAFLRPRLETILVDRVEAF